MLSTAAISLAYAQEAASLRQAVPIEPIAAILEAFRSHDVVGLSAGESHGDERGPAVLVSLIRDPRFAATTIDVVMESGNARHQELMDRFTRGKKVPYSALRRVWDDTTQPQAVDGPIGEIDTARGDSRRQDGLDGQEWAGRVFLPAFPAPSPKPQTPSPKP